jgi:hypothetical protein
MEKSIAHGGENVYSRRLEGVVMTIRRRVLVVSLSAFLGCGAAFGQAASTPDAGRFPFVFDVAPVLWGLDLGVGYRGLRLFPGTDTIVWVYGGGAYEQMAYVRLTDGTLIDGIAPGSVTPDEDIPYNRWSGRWQLGIAQGLLWNPRVGSNLLEAVIFYRGRYDMNIQARPDQLIFASSIPDRSGIFLNALLAGISYNDVLLDVRSKIKSGVSAELTGEWGPSFFFNTAFGSSDYIRLNLTARAFLPLFDATPSSETNLFSVYLCDFFSLDYAAGSSVPLCIRQTFGGIDPRTGLGGALRGVDTGSLDTNLKAVNNFEIRANLPALGLRDIVPGVLAYWDMGAYDQIGEGIGNPSPGFVTSVGGGAFLNLLDFAQLIGYINYRLLGVNADGSTLTFGFDFVLKF